jgi:hypothetical protein
VIVFETKYSFKDPVPFYNAIRIVLVAGGFRLLQWPEMFLRFKDDAVSSVGLKCQGLIILAGILTYSVALIFLLRS